MAQGDFVVFDQFILDLGNKIHDMDGDTFKIGFTSGVTDPATTTAAPHWGGTGTTDFSSEEVTGGNYTAPITLTSLSWSGATPAWDSADVSYAANASNPTTIEWGIVYNDTDANKRCVGWLDLNGGADLDTTGGLTITVSNWFTANQA